MSTLFFSLTEVLLLLVVVVVVMMFATIVLKMSSVRTATQTGSGHRDVAAASAEGSYPDGLYRTCAFGEIALPRGGDYGAGNLLGHWE